MSRERADGRGPGRRAPHPGGEVRGHPGGADRRRANAVRRAGLCRGRHRGARPRLGGHAGRPLSPLRGQGGPVSRRLRADRAGAGRAPGDRGAVEGGSLGGAARGPGDVPRRLRRAGGAADRAARRALGAGLGRLARGGGAPRPGIDQAGAPEPDRRGDDPGAAGRAARPRDPRDADRGRPLRRSRRSRGCGAGPDGHGAARGCWKGFGRRADGGRGQPSPNRAASSEPPVASPAL